MNIVTKKGEAVLIRACEPLLGLKESTRGPGRLCKALGINKSYDGYKVEEIGVGPRIGVTKAKELPLRFFIKKNKYLST